jgi:hypothetical protein
MKKSKATKIIERIALQEGVSVAEVRAEMQKAIDLAYEKCSETEEFWAKWKGRKPSPEEFIVAANAEILGKLNFSS